MKKSEIKISVTTFKDFSELSIEDKMLMNKAVEARKKAYAPYSKFNVGAALLLENSEIVLGNNQENAAYPSGMCAERVAIWKVGSDYPTIKIRKLAITASSLKTKVDKPVAPCGACRQTLSEYEINQKEPIEVLFMGEIGAIAKIDSLLALLPFSFENSFL